MSLVCVVPTIRPESIRDFKEKWSLHFRWHDVKLLVVYDGDDPRLELDGVTVGPVSLVIDQDDQELCPTRTDSCRNAGFLWAAANLDFDTLLTFDDDVAPLLTGNLTDPIGDHLSVLRTRVPTSWMNTLMGTDAEFVRGIPYSIRSESEVHVSHGLWQNVADYDGITQMYLTPTAIADPEKYRSPAYYVGPIPKGIYTSICGMSVAVTREALPLLYYCPQGDGIGYHRFGDIWMGLHLLEECWKRNWAVYSGASVINHTRASNVYKNIAAENTGLEVNENYWRTPDSELPPFFAEYTRKRLKFKDRMSKLLGVAA